MKLAAINGGRKSTLVLSLFVFGTKCGCTKFGQSIIA